MSIPNYRANNLDELQTKLQEKYTTSYTNDNNLNGVRVLANETYQWDGDTYEE